MLIRKINGTAIIEINFIDSQLKMACEAENNNDPKEAELHFFLALNADTPWTLQDDADWYALDVRGG